MTLTDNPIINMPGPAFLKFYWLLSISTLILFWVLLRLRDKSLQSPAIKLSSDPDPYEIAYVRVGVNEVLRLGILTLLQRRFITETDTYFTSRPNPPSRRHLTALEKEILNIVLDTKDIGELFTHPWIESRLEPLCEPYRRLGEEQQLVHPDSYQRLATFLRSFALWLFLGLGIYKIAIAFSRFKFNIAFLVGSLLILYFITRYVLTPTRITRKGKVWLEQLKTAHSSLQSDIATARKTDPSIILGASIFGLAVLVNSPFSDYMLMFRATANGGPFSSCGCGSSCGGSCSSCGGGCGGCGGGCGGCGGCG